MVIPIFCKSCGKKMKEQKRPTQPRVDVIYECEGCGNTKLIKMEVINCQVESWEKIK